MLSLKIMSNPFLQMQLLQAFYCHKKKIGMFQKINSFFSKNPALNFIILAIIFTVIEGLFSFCSKNDYCPAFADAAFNEWFPYQAGQTVYYKTADNKKDSLYNFKVNKSEAKTVHHGFLSPPFYCDDYAFIESQNVDSASSFLYLTYDIYTAQNFKNLQLSVNNFLVNGSDINDSGIVIKSLEYPVKSSYFNSLSLGGKVFSNVQALENDTVIFKNPGVYKIWLAKNMGVIGYEEYPSLTIWVKQ